MRDTCQEIWLQGCRVLFSWRDYILKHWCSDWCSIRRNCRYFQTNVFVVAATARSWGLFAFFRSRGLALLTLALIDAWSIRWIPSSPVPCRRLLLSLLERLSRHICVASAWLDLNVTNLLVVLGSVYIMMLIIVLLLIVVASLVTFVRLLSKHTLSVCVNLLLFYVSWVARKASTLL